MEKRRVDISHSVVIALVILVMLPVKGAVAFYQPPETQQLPCVYSIPSATDTITYDLSPLRREVRLFVPTHVSLYVRLYGYSLMYRFGPLRAVRKCLYVPAPQLPTIVQYVCIQHNTIQQQGDDNNFIFRDNSTGIIYFVNICADALPFNGAESGCCDTKTPSCQVHPILMTT